MFCVLCVLFAGQFFLGLSPVFQPGPWALDFLFHRVVKDVCIVSILGRQKKYFQVGQKRDKVMLSSDAKICLETFFFQFRIASFQVSQLWGNPLCEQCLPCFLQYLQAFPGNYGDSMPLWKQCCLVSRSGKFLPVTQASLSPSMKLNQTNLPALALKFQPS